jgi:hypothetical protein
MNDESMADPRGLRLHGATVTGRLDLDYLSTDIGCALLACTLADGITAELARLPRLHLHGSTLGRSDADQPALFGDGLIVDELLLTGVHASSRTRGGTIRLPGAHVGFALDLSGATLSNESGAALFADGLTVDSRASFDGFTATGHGDLGAVRLIGAHVGGQVSFDGATLTNDAGPALQAFSLTAGRGAFFRGGFTATGHGTDAAVSLHGAQVGGQLDFSGATLTSDAGPALFVDGLAVDGGAFLRGGFTATGHGNVGAVRLLDAHIGGPIDLSGAILTNDAYPPSPPMVSSSTATPSFPGSAPPATVIWGPSGSETW